MIDYHQPNFYRFNEDSIKLVKWVGSKVNTAGNILDLGAGCGVIGIELARLLLPRHLTLLEVQGEYLSSLERNRGLFLKSGIECEIVMKSFQEWVPLIHYDLIVCNPPYYLPGHGEKGKDIRRETARSFIIDGWDILLRKISVALSENGRAFLVIKNDKRILSAINNSNVSLQKTFQENGDLLFVELMRLDKN